MTAHQAPKGAPNQSALKTAIHTALKEWHKEDAAHSPLASLRIFKVATRQSTSNPQAVAKEIITDALDALAETHAQDAQLLRSRYLDNELAFQVANRENVSEATLYRHQSTALDRLSEIVLKLEQAAQVSYRHSLQQRLELPTYTRLIGVDAHCGNIADFLLKEGPPWLVAIEGIGGIGKTSLANATARHMIATDRWDDYGWVTARQANFNLGGAITPVERPALETDALVEELVNQLLPDLARAAASLADKRDALQKRLQEQPHLIVIDNLETLIDLKKLAPTLRELSNPTKFLLTTRKSLYDEMGIAHFRVPELAKADAIALVRQEAEMRSLQQVISATDDELAPIVDVVGGNPLALRLVVGQLQIHALSHVLRDLYTARSESTANLYTFIYRKAWESLTEPERKALLVMPLANPKGATLDRLADMGQIDAADLYQALNRLVSLNLVDSRGGLNARYYSLHSLTRAFLHEQVLQWQAE
ncbi:MAG: NB-ARC domain-containing protein [Caldilineaceae bacterium]